MSAVIHISTCIVLWAVVLIRWRALHHKCRPFTESEGRDFWLSLLFFTLALTFLVDVVASWFDSWTANNLSRLIAYSTAAITLYFSVAASMRAFQSQVSKPVKSLLKLGLAVTVGIFITIYVLYIAQTPIWQKHHIPQSFAEAAFMFPLFAYAFMLCMVQLYNSIRCFRQEKVRLMCLRIGVIIATTITGSAYALIKMAMILGFFWYPLKSVQLVNLSLALLFLTTGLWMLMLINNKFYRWLIDDFQSVYGWIVLKDLYALILHLDKLCPAVAMTDEKPAFHQFIHNPSYHLYRAIIRILDGKTLLDDYLTQPPDSCQWSSQQIEDARKVSEALKTVQPGDDFWKIVCDYQRVSRMLFKSMQTTNRLPL